VVARNAEDGFYYPGSTPSFTVALLASTMAIYVPAYV